jgi:hypothetical protein
LILRAAIDRRFGGNMMAFTTVLRKTDVQLQYGIRRRPEISKLQDYPDS